MTEKRNVLVTGAAGVIGQGFISPFWRDVQHHRARSQRSAGVKTLIANIDDLDAIAPAFDGVESVVHLAAAISVDSPWDAVLHANLIGTYNVFEAARKAGVANRSYSRHRITPSAVMSWTGCRRFTILTTHEFTIIPFRSARTPFMASPRSTAKRSGVIIRTRSGCGFIACGSVRCALTIIRATHPSQRDRSGSISRLSRSLSARGRRGSASATPPV